MSTQNRPVSRRTFLGKLGWGAAALAAPAGLAAAGAGGKRPPNLVFFLADDLGWRDTSLYGSTFYETPNIDRLARRGMRFTNAYAANPLCSPTRASIMTGLYPARIGITAPVCHIAPVVLEETLQPAAPPWRKALIAWSATRLDLPYFTLAEALQSAGYATGHFGKWHLGREPYDPLHQGFDSDIPHWPGPGPAGSYIAPWRFPNFKGKPGEHIEDRMGREAVRFIRKHRDKPFFLNYWCFSVHSPYGAKKDLIAKYRAKAAAHPDNPQRNPIMGAMVESLDDNVGRVVRALDELGLTDNTIIVFFSDNGGVHWAEEKTGPAPVTSNAPLRGGKATIYEGGTREPLVVVWPGVVRPGSVSNEIVSSIDFYPSILEMLEMKPRPDQQFDGISIVPALKGGRLKRDAVFCDFPHYVIRTGNLPSSYVRRGDWKLIRFYADGVGGKDRFELYNLREDIGEEHNLAERYPERVRALDALIAKHLAEIKAVIPKPNPAYDPKCLPPDRVRPVAGWTPSGYCTLTLEGGALEVRSLGKDPFVSTSGPFPRKPGPFLIRFRMTTDAPGNGQVFWQGAPARPFHHTRSVGFVPKRDGRWHEYEVRVPIETPLTALRIDPATGPGRIAFDWIRVYGADGTVLRAWEFAPDVPKRR
ncbi:MAG: sulfatase [Kiritimatiellaeota bacterium]|nr:sulfatase [Kiritimatiellota bacterium]